MRFAWKCSNAETFLEIMVLDIYIYIYRFKYIYIYMYMNQASILKPF